MEKKLSILFILNSMNWGGLGRILSDLSCRLPNDLHQTLVLLENKVFYPYHGQLVIIQERYSKHLPVKVLKLFQSALKFRRILKKANPDAVVVFHHDARIVHLLAKATTPAMRYKTVLADLGLASHYSRYLRGLRKQIYRLLTSMALRQADRVIAISEGVKAELRTVSGSGGKKIDVIYGSVDPEQARQMATESVEHPWFSEGIPIVALSGRLVVDKNQADLLRAFAIARQNTRCRLVLIGDGPQKNNLMGLSSELGVSQDVLFTGYQSNPHKFVARSSVFAFTSVFEAQGLVMIEAMAVGCPVVAFDCPVGPREMLAPGTSQAAYEEGIEEAQYGILVRPGNVVTLAKAILKLLGDSPLRRRYSQIARERATHFNAQDMAQKYLNSIKAALDA